MSLATLARRSRPSPRCLSHLSTGLVRHASTSAPPPEDAATTTTSTNYPSHESLPPAKMRALISLYHQSESWVTPENLNERIDDAFLPVLNTHMIALPSQESVSYEDLQTFSEKMREKPKMALLESGSEDGQHALANMRWGGATRILSKRETKVFEALYGLEVERGHGKSPVVLPGLEVLKELKRPLAKEREEDRQKAMEEEDEDIPTI